MLLLFNMQAETLVCQSLQTFEVHFEQGLTSSVLQLWLLSSSPNCPTFLPVKGRRSPPAMAPNSSSFSKSSDVNCSNMTAGLFPKLKTYGITVLFLLLHHCCCSCLLVYVLRFALNLAMHHYINGLWGQFSLIIQSLPWSLYQKETAKGTEGLFTSLAGESLRQCTPRHDAGPHQGPAAGYRWLWPSHRSTPKAAEGRQRHNT